MHSLFFDNSNKLRSGWRAAIFLIAFFVLAKIFLTIEEIVISSLTIDLETAKLLFFVVNSLGLLLLALLIGGIAGKFFENLPYKALGAAFTKAWLRHLTVGIAIGGATLSLAVLITLVFGGESFELNLSGGMAAVASSLAVSFVIFAAGAAWEEAFFRGYILQTFSRSGLAWLAILLTSLFFGAVHLGNPNANLISTVNTILAGIWFSVAYLKTRDLWFVWGIHLMWNWMQGSFFGIEVSGLTNITTTPLLKEIDSGPSWLTGQNYGIEGGVACTFALVLSMGLIYFLPMSESEQPAVAGGKDAEKELAAD